MDPDLLSFVFLSISSLFIIVNPLGATVTYVSLVEGMEPEAKAKVARTAVQVALVVMIIFAIAGSWILQLFGITIDAFRIAGGILLFGIGMEMVYAKTSRTKLTATEKYESIDADDVAIMPLAIPMIAGPGAITTVVVLSTEAMRIHLLTLLIVIAAAALSVAFTYYLMRNADRILETVGQRELRVMNRLMGILLIAIAVQFVINGLLGTFPFLAAA